MAGGSGAGGVHAAESPRGLQRDLDAARRVTGGMAAATAAARARIAADMADAHAGGAAELGAGQRAALDMGGAPDQDEGGDALGEGPPRASGIESCGIWRWPMYRILQESFECDTLRQAELEECITGYKSLRDNEKWELTYWYGITTRLCDSLAAHDDAAAAGEEGCCAQCGRGGERLPPGQQRLLSACYRQAEERLTYLSQVAACSEPDNDHTRAYWQTLARHELEDRRSTPVRGALGRAHATTQAALRTARAKATAQSELARLRVQGKKNG